MGEQKLSYHHSTVGFNFVHVQIQILEVTTFFESFGQELSSLTFDFIALDVEAEKSWTLANKISECLCSLISNVVVTQINVFDVNCKLIECRA